MKSETKMVWGIPLCIGLLRARQGIETRHLLKLQKKLDFLKKNA